MKAELLPMPPPPPVMEVVVTMSKTEAQQLMKELHQSLGSEILGLPRVATLCSEIGRTGITY